jgi:hypothetical protein
MDAQKKSLVATERDEVKRAAWREAIGQIAEREPARLKFIDESACHLSLKPSRRVCMVGRNAVSAVSIRCPAIAGRANRWSLFSR